MAGLFRRRGTALLLVIVSAILVAAIACEGSQGGRGSQGSSGATGPLGATGSQGSQGVPGKAGPAGPSGSQGAQGPAGSAGVPGLQGPAGPTGAAGQQGPTGAQGASGVQGSQGISGEQGPQGIQGAEGEQGPAGEAGGSAAVLVVHDTANNVAGAVEIKSSTTEMDILGGGFEVSELIALTVSINGKDVVLGSGQGNGHGAFLSTVTVPSSMKVGGPYTITATGSGGNVGFGVVVVTNKDSSD